MRHHLIRVVQAGIFLTLFFPAVFQVSAQNRDTEEERDYQYARELYSGEMYDMAAKELERFIDTYPSSPNAVSAQYFLAGSYFYQKQFPKTIEIAKSLLKDHPSAPIVEKILFLAGKAYFQLKEYKEGIDAFERMIAGFPAGELASEALYNIGESRYALKEYPEAAKTY